MLECLLKGYCAEFHFGIKIGRLKWMIASKIRLEPLATGLEKKPNVKWIN